MAEWIWMIGISNRNINCSTSSVHIHESRYIPLSQHRFYFPYSLWGALKIQHLNYGIDLAIYYYSRLKTESRNFVMKKIGNSLLRLSLLCSRNTASIGKSFSALIKTYDSSLIGNRTCYFQSWSKPLPKKVSMGLIFWRENFR